MTLTIQNLQPQVQDPVYFCAFTKKWASKPYHALVLHRGLVQPFGKNVKIYICQKPGQNQKRRKNIFMKIKEKSRFFELFKD
ncbi:MAG: hypothetical protein B5M56_09455 [Desulfococcus sp. 4484_241]|nr:MAG: hypothetical protein B5M56_09455 [Desulfococcus sp. 4484_241]